MALSTVPVLVVQDNVDDDAVLISYPLPIISEGVIAGDRIEYYWGL